MKRRKLENKTVFIAGNLSEIGKCCAIAAAREGANIVIADVESYEKEQMLEEIKYEASGMLFIPCNISAFEDVSKAVKKVVNTFGAIDIALNNSEIDCETNMSGKRNKKIWLKTIGDDLNGVFNCMSYELDEMEKQKKGVILNLVSVSGKPGFLESPHYIATKHGIIGLTKTASLEFESKGVRINALCPGFIEIPGSYKSEFPAYKAQSPLTIDSTTIKKMERAKEIANGFIFMASDDNPFISGTAVEIDGGYLSQ